MDIKNDRENYAKIIGFDRYDTKKLEKTVEFFLTHNYGYEFRTTLIKEYHKEENIIKIGEWIKGANKYSMQKFKAVDTCIAQGLHEVDMGTAEKFLKAVTPFVKQAKLRGY